ncbi:hypothetical protein B0H19DRAFT_900981, partial [Mycena capillaripes]
MSAERRNELLAKGLCFTCEEPGHLSRNCPKTSAVISKKKGRPPGISSNAATIAVASTSDDAKEYDFLSVSATDSEFISEDEDIPPLQEVSDSESESSVLDPTETFESRLRLWEHAIIEQERRLRNPLPRAHRIGDILGESAAALLEFLQPFPGDERVSWADEQRDTRRFEVIRVSEDSYEIHDSFSGEITILPFAFLKVPHFQIARWYASILEQQLDV